METQQQPQQQPGQIHAAICAIMGEVGGVGKTKTNTIQNYKFRGIADLYLACQPIMAKHGVHVSPVAIEDHDMQVGKTKHGGDSYHVTMRVRFRAYAVDGSFVEVQTMGEAMDTSDKAFNKAASAAMKYALIQLFAIPEEDPEIDTESGSPEMNTGKAEAKDAKQEAADAAKRQKEAMDALVKLLGTKGVTGGKAVLAWLTQQTRRDIKKLSDLSFEEHKTAKEVAEKLPTKGEQKGAV